MTVRSGMEDLVSQFRSYVKENGNGIFTDTRIQQILDSNSQYVYQHPLSFFPQRYNGSVIYTQYFSEYPWLEGTATSTVQIYNANGTVVTNYTSDFVLGKFTFNSNTLGTVYYLDSRTVNFYKAVSDGWKEKASFYATQFDLKVEGREFKKSQVVQSCLAMAKEYASKGSVIQHSLDRGDMQGNMFGGYDVD